MVLWIKPAHFTLTLGLCLNAALCAGELSKRHVSERCRGDGAVHSEGGHGREGNLDTLDVTCHMC